MACNGKLPPPVIKPRPMKNPADSHIYDVPRTSIALSKMSPHNVQPKNILDCTLTSPDSNGSILPPDFPSEDETLNLASLVSKYAHLIPLRVKAVSGFMAENEGDPTICVDDVYNIHAVKQTEVVTIIDSRKQKYSLPLHSATKFGLVGDWNETLSVLDLQNASVLPPVIATMNRSECVYYSTYCFRANEILLTLGIIKNKQGEILVKVFSVTEAKQKFILGPDMCNIRFTTHPVATKLYLSEIIKHAVHLLPCRAQLFISQAQAKLPKHLTTKEVTLQPNHIETSLIISLHRKNSSQEQTVYIDVPVSINIDVRVLRPETPDDYTALFQDSHTLVSDYHPKKLQACVNADDDDMYATQDQLLKALRKGYEKAGTTIKTSGVDHTYQFLDKITEAAAGNEYQVLMLSKSAAEQSSVNYQVPNSHQDPQNSHKDVTPYSNSDNRGAFQNEQLSIVIPEATNSRPSTLPCVKLPTVPRNRTKTSPTIDKTFLVSPSSSSSLNHSNPSAQPKSSSQTPHTEPEEPLTPLSLKPNEVSTTVKPAIIPRSGTIKKATQQMPVRSRKNIVPLPPKTYLQQPVGSPPVDHSETPIQENSEATKREISVNCVQPVKREGKREGVESDSAHQSVQALQAINESLRLLLAKVEKVQQKQASLEADVDRLRSGLIAERKLPMRICSMTQKDVQGLLEAMGLSQYKKAFSNEWVDGEILMDLDDEALQELGVGSKLHRLKLMRVITDSVYPSK